MLEALEVSGVVGLARREGNRKYVDLVERLYPAELLAVRPSEAEQPRHKLLSRYRAHLITGPERGRGSDDHYHLDYTSRHKAVRHLPISATP